MITPPQGRLCTSVGHETMVVQYNEGYISSSLAHTENGWGSPDCPWKIKGQPGQKINITVLDFHPDPSKLPCQVQGGVKDPHNDQEVAICRTNGRVQHVYLSTGSAIDIWFDESRNTEDNFLLHFQGIFRFL